MVSPPDDTWFRKFFAEQRRIDKLLNPYSETIMRHQRILDSINIPALEYQRSILEQASIRDYLSIAGISNDYLTLQQEIQNSLGSISAITKEIEFLKHSSVFDPIITAQENLYRFQDQFSQTKDLFELPSARIESVLAAAEAISRMFHPQDFYSDFTLSSVMEYQSFLERQYRYIQHDNDMIAGRRMQINDLAGGLFEIINASLDIGATLEGQEEVQSEDAIYDEKVQVGLYGQINQHLGFVYSGRYSGEIETSFNDSLPARISCLGYAITEQIYKINSICENNGQDHVFKPTSRTMRACGTIPSLVARSEIDFYYIIDHLFFLLYEGSGTANRLIPIINESFLAPLWKVKHLRLSARHDIDHGSIKEVEKKRSKISDTYISLIAKPLPIRQSDWQKAQLQIYIEIDLMLQKIIHEITSNN
ncbi:hypothetical protein LCGC14_2289190 [marine sediment metagenome]|uniref:Uncharacterized protein n=1 Tax=marine sediment metagenome TaxID=412755 RepID=A0A0F9FLX3_9ZZZZ|nr:hypothetical protein [Desulfobacterales bacterium]